MLILDEFDSIIFCSSNNLDQIHAGLKNAHLLIGLSGSDLKDYHVRAAERIIAGRLARMKA